MPENSFYVENGSDLYQPETRCHGQGVFVRFSRLHGEYALSTTKKFTEVEVVRVKITLACTECKQRNYNMTKEKKNHPDRMETKKYCRFCKSHTLHKETK